MVPEVGLVEDGKSNRESFHSLPYLAVSARLSAGKSGGVATIPLVEIF